MTSAFSRPPIRCSRPAVPGIAHGRASVSGSRRKGSKGALARLGELHRDLGQVVDPRDEPRLRPVREVRVREEVDRGAVLERDARRLDRGVEALRRARRRDDRHGALAVPAEQHHQQIRLLGLGRHPGRRTRALDVEDQSGSSSAIARPTVSAFRTTPGPADAVTPSAPPNEAPIAAPTAAISSSAWNVTTPKSLRPRELLEDRRCRGDRVRAEEEGQAGQPRRCDQPVRQCGVPGDLAVRARRERRGRHLVRDREVLRGLAVVPACAERLGVRLDDLGPFRELLPDERERPVHGPVVEPRHQPEREEVLRALGLARGDSVDPLQRADGHRGERDLVHVVVAERAVIERALCIPRLLQRAVAERVGVDDDRAALREIAQVRLERRGVHRNEDVRPVAGGEDVVVREVDLEPGDAGERPGRRADLRREVRERREVVAERRRLAREAVAGELHPVARVARKADDHSLELLDPLRGHELSVARARVPTPGSGPTPAAQRPRERPDRRSAQNGVRHRFLSRGKAWRVRSNRCTGRVADARVAPAPNLP